MNSKQERLFDTLEKARIKLVEELSRFNHQDLNRPENNGKWSIIQTMKHIADVEEGTGMYIRKKTQKPELVPPTPFFAGQKLFLLELSVRSGAKFKAPPALANLPADLRLADVAEAWDSSRQSLHQLMLTLPVDIQEKGLFRHPIIGRLNMQQTLGFMEVHFQHHLNQINNKISLLS